MSNPVYRRCGCRGKDGKQLGGSCPELRQPETRAWAYYLSGGTETDPNQPGRQRRRQFRKGGFKTKRDAQ